MSIVPVTRPKLTKEDALKLIQSFTKEYPVKILGIRGYYKDSMGDIGRNDRAIYDDCICIIAPDYFNTFNANTDPSRHMESIASLKKGGPYLYKIGLHNMKNPYEALRQYGRVTVIRDGGKEETDTPAAPFFIDIHKGGYTTTSSLGCQTIFPQQWEGFLSEVKAQLKKYNQTIIPYYLVEA